MLLVLIGMALANTTVQVGSMSADGLEIRDLDCSLESGGLFASALVVASLAEHKDALDACAPQGGAFAASWSWGAGSTSEVSSGVPESGNRCVQKALQATQTDLKGQCTAVVLVGEPEGALAAYQALKGEPAAPEPTETAPAAPPSEAANTSK